MAEPLILTKVAVPPLSSGRVLRSRLLDLLGEVVAPACRLALVCAPAGYGKTSLVIEWIEALKMSPVAAPAALARCCWLSLDDGDNNPSRFLAYLLAALQQALSIAEELRSAVFGLSPGSPIGALLAAIVNQLAAAPAPVILVLDDYHIIRTPEVHDIVRHLIDHGPQNFHLVLTTRSDPPFALHRYRARRQMVDVRLDALRFTTEETAAFLRQLYHLALDPEDVAVLEQRTEGWAAGLQMAALSLRGRSDAAGFVRALSGSNRYILDYLAEEVLAGLPSDVQAFMLSASVLDRLSAPLCDAVLGAGFFPSSPSGFAGSQDVLEYLERANLFVMPLDDERTWYRCHALLADLLRARLQRRDQNGTHTAELHRRAALWFAAAGVTRLAIRHTIQAGDFEQAANLVEAHTLQLFSQGELAPLLEWAQMLPPNLAARRPWLSIYQAWALGFAGRVDEAARLVETAGRAIAAAPLSVDEVKALQAEIIALRAMLAMMTGDLPAVLALEHVPEDTFPGGSQFARSVVCWSLGFAWRTLGDVRKAGAAFEETLQIGYQTGNLWTLLTATVDLGTALRLSGRLVDAERIYRQGLEQARQAGVSGAGFTGRLESFLAATLYERDALDEALGLVEDSIAHNRLWANPNHQVHAFMVHARILQARGDLDAAKGSLRQAEIVAHSAPIVPPLSAGLAAARARLLLAQGRLAEAAAWARSQPDWAGATAPFSEMGAALLIAQARIALALGDPAQALSALDRLASDAHAGGKLNTLIETHGLRALALHAQGRLHEALTALSEALAIGLPAGYRRTYLDEGEPLRRLLEELQSERTGHSTILVPTIDACATEMAALLAAFPPLAASETLGELQPASLLTRREVEILRWMAAGLSNAEIGKRLFISPGTVKAHSAAIYRKLNAANRAEAVSSAKDMGLL